MKLDINIMFKNYSRELLSINKEVRSIFHMFKKKKSMENLKQKSC